MRHADSPAEEVEAGRLLRGRAGAAGADGGGGWGDPLERDPNLVSLEIRQGLVTPEGAKNYGVIADQNGHVDVGQTESLRAEMKAERGELPLFDYGPSIEKLRENCEAETGLPAPLQPVWKT